MNPPPPDIFNNCVAKQHINDSKNESLFLNIFFLNFENKLYTVYHNSTVFFETYSE